ncbi:hypothetical protein [Streptosporangium longisporum]|uniref:hypothetical protein n=1 Tax=Streptosporangium longisporum TaxID=46187 RepID=UPI0031E66430
MPASETGDTGVPGTGDMPAPGTGDTGVPGTGDVPIAETGDTGVPEPGDVPFDERVGDFYSPGVPLSRVRPRPRATAVPADLLLRILEPPAVKVRHIPLVDLLRKPYRELGGD